MATLAALALACTLVVVVVSAALRRAGDPVAGLALSSTDVQLLRALHRLAATAELALVVAATWITWRARRIRPELFDLASGTLAVTMFLALIGVAGGQRPGLLIAVGNLLGGLVLASLLAWIFASARRDEPSTPKLVLSGVLGLQAIGGALLSLAWRAEDGPLLPQLVHLFIGAMLGMGLLAWAFVRRTRFGMIWVAPAAVLAPALGLLAMLMPGRGAWSLMHGASVAVLLVVVAIASARS